MKKVGICNGEFSRTYRISCERDETLNGYDAKYSLLTDSVRSCEGQFDVVESRSPEEVLRSCGFGKVGGEYCMINAETVRGYFRQRILLGEGLNPVPKRIEIRFICSSEYRAIALTAFVQESELTGL